eukprot:3842688-Rhodomonas_salina.1
MSLQRHTAGARIAHAHGNRSRPAAATAAALVLLYATSLSFAGASLLPPSHLSSWSSPQPQQQQPYQLLQVMRGGASADTVKLRFRLYVEGTPSFVVAAGDLAQLGCW